MLKSDAIVLSGAACHSLGIALVESCLRQFPDLPIIIVGRHCHESGQISKLIFRIDFDLNPLVWTAGFDEFAKQLEAVTSFKFLYQLL
jgi:hypothetical protein